MTKACENCQCAKGGKTSIALLQPKDSAAVCEAIEDAISDISDAIHLGMQSGIWDSEIGPEIRLGIKLGIENCLGHPAFGNIVRNAIESGIELAASTRQASEQHESEAGHV